MARSEMDLFPDSYQASRARFRGEIGRVRAGRPDARLERHTLNAEDLSIDWIAAPPRGRPERVLVMTTGEHGIEGYVGSAVLRLFLDEFLPRLDPATTGLLLVHAINPWGMKHRRRTNAANVDLNRNFSAGPVDPATNRDYDKLYPFLNPQRPLDPPGRARLRFAAGLLRRLIRPGPAVLQRAMLLGQYRHARGIYYGGSTLQPETKVMIRLYRASLAAYPQLVQVDVHSGYGPRRQMAVVSSYLEPVGPAALAERFAYPRVVKSGGDGFYAMQGDMIDYLYQMAGAEFPRCRLFAASLEFGTFGDSLLAGARGARALVWENQAYWHGAAPATQAVVAREFGEMFYPSDAAWRAKALADARRALEGILRAEGYLLSE